MLLINLFQNGFGLQLTATVLFIGDGMDYKTFRNNFIVIAAAAAFGIAAISHGAMFIGIAVLLLCVLCLLSIIV